LPREIDPIVGNWYAHLDKGQRFTVTAISEDDDTVELQHFDGDVEEVSTSDWYELDIELSEEPENWSGALDISEVDDFGTEITDTSKEDWSAPLNEFRKPREDSSDPDKDDTEDEWGEGHMREQQLEPEE